MKKFLLLLVIFVTLTVSSCANRDKMVVIYSSAEDYRAKVIQEELKKEFPDFKIILQYYSTGTNAAKLKAEGKDTSADIVLGLEVGFSEKIKDNFAELTKYDTSNYLEEVLPPHQKYHIFSKEAGCIIINKKVLKEKGLPIPQSYNELLDSKYKNLIMMPNPKSSGTGYYFYNSLVANWGEETALKYFSSLSKNVKQFSESGSGPVKAIDKGEIAVGLGMTFQAVSFKKDNPDLDILYFEEGSPYSLYAMSIVKGREKKENVVKVYDYLYNYSTQKDKDQFVNDFIFKDQKVTIEGYPQDVKYSSMKNIFDYKYKEDLLSKWEW